MATSAAQSSHNPLDALNLETRRAQFTFYGWKRAADGSVGGPYFKLAHSFAEAYGDLLENPGMRRRSFYVVNDVFVEVAEDGTPNLHIELRDLGDALAE